MNELMCRYPEDREQAIVAYVYGELDAEARARFDAHLSTCARCRTEVSAFSDVRSQLDRWAVPDAGDGRQSTVVSHQSTVVSPITSHEPRTTSLELRALSSEPRITSHEPRPTWWLQLPVWAQVAAAVLIVGVAAGVANVDIHQDASGLHVRTGWSKAPEAAEAPTAVAAASPVNDVATRDELTALETRLRAELNRAATGANTVGAINAVNTTNPGVNGNGVNAETVRRVKALLDESEKRQQRELALRVGELVRDVNAQRQADLVRIDRSLGVIQSNTGVEMMRQRETLNNLLVRTSLQK